MFHVAPLLPFTENDPQQLQRKRHIGKGKEKAHSNRSICYNTNFHNMNQETTLWRWCSKRKTRLSHRTWLHRTFCTRLSWSSQLTPARPTSVTASRWRPATVSTFSDPLYPTHQNRCARVPSWESSFLPSCSTPSTPATRLKNLPVSNCAPVRHCFPTWSTTSIKRRAISFGYPSILFCPVNLR